MDEVEKPSGGGVCGGFDLEGDADGVFGRGGGEAGRVVLAGLGQREVEAQSLLHWLVCAGTCNRLDHPLADQSGALLEADFFLVLCQFAGLFVVARDAHGHGVAVGDLHFDGQLAVDEAFAGKIEVLKEVTFALIGAQADAAGGDAR
jgi:hypothetical protein